MSAIDLAVFEAGAVHGPLTEFWSRRYDLAFELVALKRAEIIALGDMVPGKWRGMVLSNGCVTVSAMMRGNKISTSVATACLCGASTCERWLIVHPKPFEIDPYDFETAAVKVFERMAEHSAIDFDLSGVAFVSVLHCSSEDL